METAPLAKVLTNLIELRTLSVWFVVREAESSRKKELAVQLLSVIVAPEERFQLLWPL